MVSMQTAILSSVAAFVLGMVIGWLVFGRKRPRATTVSIDRATCQPGLIVRVVGKVNIDAGYTLKRVWAKVFDSAGSGVSPPTGAVFIDAGSGNPYNFTINVPTLASNTGTDVVRVWSEWEGLKQPAGNRPQ